MNSKCLIHLPLVALAALLFAPPSVSAQSILGSAGNYVLLAGTTVTVAGTVDTFSNGNVGAPTLAAITGFPPATIVNGTTVAIGAGTPPEITALIAAQGALNAMAPIANLSGIDLAGLTLAPGVYKFNAGAGLSVNGVLTLDAQGKNNVTWVFNIGSTLTTFANAKVQFINLGTNGGKDNGLFWNAGFGITLGAENIIAGNYLAGSAISIGDTVPGGPNGGSGRALAQTAVTMSGKATMDALGTGGDLTGGLTLNGVKSGYVLLSSNGTYTQGLSSVVLTPGILYNTNGVTVDGNSADAPLKTLATLTVFGTNATLTGTNNTYTGGTIVDGALVATPGTASTLTTGAANLPTNGNVSLIDSNTTGTFGALNFNQATLGSYGGVISGGGTVTKSGASALAITNTNTYTGATTVTAGTLEITDALLTSGSINGSSGIIINGVGAKFLQTGTVASTPAITLTQGTLDGTGSVGAVTVANAAGNIVTNGNGTTSTLTVASLKFNGAGTININKFNDTGTAALAITGALTTTPLNGLVTLNLLTPPVWVSGNTYNLISYGSFGGLNSDFTLTGLTGHQSGTLGNTGAGAGFITLAIVIDKPVWTGLVGTSASTTPVGGLQNWKLQTAGGGTEFMTNDQALFDDTATGTTNVAINDATFSPASTTFNNSTKNYTLTGANGINTGSLTKSGTGTLTVSNPNTYAGGTTITAGTVALSGAGTLGAPTGALAVNGGTLDLGTTSQTVGAVTLGGGTISNGTLTGASYTSTGGTVSAVLAGTGVFTNTSGTTTLTNLNTYTGLTTVSGGTLYIGTSSVPGSIGATTVASGAFLDGNGTIHGALVNNGTVSPGFSPGTIIVVGNYTQGAGGTLVMQIASAASYDQLIIGGNASLAGTLQVDLLGVYNPAGQSFKILTTTGSVAGAFSAITGSAALTASIAYNPKDVTVSFVQGLFSAFALTPNQTAIANAAQASPALTAALNLVPLASQMPAALNALSPQGYEVWSDIAFAHATALTDRLARNDYTVSGHTNYYFEAGQRRGYAKGDLDVNSSKYDSNGGLVGGNYAVSPNLTLGGFFEYSETSSGLGSYGSETNIKDKMFGVRAAWTQDQWFAHAVLAYGFESYKSTRSIVFPGTAAVANSSTHGHQWIADISGGRQFTAGIVTLSPFVGLLASRWEANGFTESGAGAFNATVARQTANSLRTQAGLESSLNFKIGTMALRPHVRAAWLHELADDSRSMNAAFGPVNYAIATRKPQRDSALLGAGLDLALSPSTSLYSDFSVQSGGSSRVMGEWRAGISIGF